MSAASWPHLSERESQVLNALISGDRPGTVAKNLGVTKQTLDVYIQRAKVKFGAWTRHQLVAIAQERMAA